MHRAKIETDISTMHILHLMQNELYELVQSNTFFFFLSGFVESANP